ncbi:hypothetical protein [Hyalangium rubrum]|uniref:Uncharacterized protein n=1 Tax=Hyalangium rubrum TaxID=3103134 RepID=A0ABU5HB04_9BACT|nr:hypothetical protein [Hyalangium sp. s54d21]MDY7230274.1 hypothetical protein [Hyalangium sp. s54d21]
MLNQFLLIGLASIGVNTTEIPEEEPTTLPGTTCTATVLGPTYSFGGRMYFHFETTCDAPVAAITINASVVGPTSAYGSKTCLLTNKCTFWLAATYKRGTWTWTNNTSYTFGTSVASQTLTFKQ